MSHENYFSEISNGWKLITEFVKFDNKSESYETHKYDFIDLDELEKLHYRILQFYEDFKELPKVGDKIIDDKDSSLIVEREINVQKKIIRLLFQ